MSETRDDASGLEQVKESGSGEGRAAHDRGRGLALGQGLDVAEEHVVEDSCYAYRDSLDSSLYHSPDHVQVVGASLENGLLHVDLVREIPEAQKPRTIPIGKAGAAPKVVETQKAA